MMSRKGTAAPEMGAVGSPALMKPDCLGGIVLVDAVAIIATLCVLEYIFLWSGTLYNCDLISI